jgi:lipopolysaccharide/colanic/teichoic acid biosynthesis glycosyltransferase
VGPRPCLTYELEMFPEWAARRFELTPGLTGVWQVTGRARVSFREGLGMDMYYFYARSFAEDLRLMIQTVRVMVGGQGGE